MKTTIIVMFAAILFCWSTTAQAQLNFGIKAGYNSSLTLGNFGSVTTGSYDLNSVKAHDDIMIENGRLVNDSPMQSLSSYLRVEDLSDIRFATLHNQIDIANQVL